MHEISISEGDDENHRPWKGTSMRREYRNGLRVIIGAVGLALAGLAPVAWADDWGNIYIATPDDRLVPKPPKPPGEPDSAYTPDAVHTYRWDGGIYVEEDFAPDKPGTIGVQPDPATANVDPAEVPPGNVIVLEPLEKQERGAPH
jgi:hypothetical protein